MRTAGDDHVNALLRIRGEKRHGECEKYRNTAKQTIQKAPPRSILAGILPSDCIMAALLSMTPISGAPALMSDRGDNDMIRRHAIKDRVGKPIQHERMGTAQSQRPSQRCLPDAPERVIDLERECFSSSLTTLVVPPLLRRVLDRPRDEF
jgi:hypothetical protein